MSEYNTQSTTYTAGYVTAYGAAKRGGYTGTYDEFCAAIAGMADVVGDLENFSVVINTLSPGSQATASYADGVLTLGVPQGAKGDKGDKGDTGEVSQADLDAAIEEVSGDIDELKNDLNQFPNGTYPNMSVGNADQLTSTVGIEDTTPYLFRTSGGSNDIGDRETVNKIVGGTVVHNQLVENGNFENASGWSYSNCNIAVVNNELTMTTTGANLAGMIYRSGNFPVGHKMFVALLAKGTVPKMRVRYPFQSDTINITETYTLYAFVGAVTATEEISATKFSVQSVQDTLEAGKTLSLKYVMCTDLTQDFGTAIADYVYSLEQATAGAGVAWLKTHFPKQFDAGYQAYDAGSLQSVSGLTAHRMVGFNQWDEEAETGYISDSTGADVVQAGYIRSKNYNRCLPSTQYNITKTAGVWVGIYWYDADKNFISMSAFVAGSSIIRESPVNTSYFRISVNATTYNHDICINFHWDGEKDGTYEPYKEYVYPLDSSLTLRGIPKVDANGNLYYDGDEYLPDGTVNRRYGIVDLGTLTWHVNNHAELGAYFYADVTSLGIKYGRHQSIIDEVGVCPKYTFSTRTVATFADKTICYDGNNTAITQVCIKDSAYSDGATFKASLSGVYLVYVKQTPTTETASPYQATQIVDDFGTEEYVLADGAFPVPVGHDTMYQNNLRAKLEMSPDSPDGDGLYVVQQESGENTYVPLASTTTIQDILTRLTALENA